MLALAPPVARAGTAPSRAGMLLGLCPDQAKLRAELTRLADSLRADPAAAADPIYWRATSRARAGLADSAIADFRRAGEWRGLAVDWIGLADALIARARPGDLEEAAGLMERHSAAGPLDEIHALRARLGWSLFLSGQVDSANRVYQAMLDALDPDPLWRVRAGRVLAEAPGVDPHVAFDWLFPEVLKARGADRGAIESLQKALERDPRSHDLDVNALVRTAVARGEAAERLGVESRGGRLLRFSASDGFPISAALFAGAPRSPVAVLLMGRADSLAGYDSLVVALRAAGLATLLIERRGTRGAAGPGCAGAGDFYGREDALEERIARDARETLRHAAHEAPLDTTRVMIGGVRDAAGTALLAATRMRTRALLLVSPEVPRVDLGLNCARIAKLMLPMFIQLAPEDYDVVIPADALYQSGARSASRVADSRAPGRGAELFRGDPNVAPRLARWLSETLKAPPPSATRR